MSTYVAKAYNPVSKLIEDATYVDDYYGRHKYGIRFDDGCVHPYAQCGLDAAATALTAKDKEIEALRDSLKAWSSRYQHMSECEKLAEARAETAERERGIATRSHNAMAEMLTDIRRERDEARAALKFYADTYCEGWCEQDAGCANFSDDDCGGCLARRAARAVIKQGE